MSIRCFKKENLYCVWDDSLVGKEVVVADSLGSLYAKLELGEVPIDKVKPGFCPEYPFVDLERGAGWKFAYMLEEPTNNTGNCAIKNAYLQGHVIARRYANGEWESMSSSSYFDLPGYEYRVASHIPSRVTNKVLALWLSQGNGLLLEERINWVSNMHSFPAEGIDHEVEEGYKVMPVGCDKWLEPTTEVCVIKDINCERV